MSALRSFTVRTVAIDAAIFISAEEVSSCRVKYWIWAAADMTAIKIGR